MTYLSQLNLNQMTTTIRRFKKYIYLSIIRSFYCSLIYPSGILSFIIIILHYLSHYSIVTYSCSLLFHRCAILSFCCSIILLFHPTFILFLTIQSNFQSYCILPLFYFSIVNSSVILSFSYSLLFFH